MRGQSHVVNLVSCIDPDPRVCYAQSMMTRRDYAASLGLAIAGARGKLSGAAHDAIAKAEANGMEFKDTVFSTRIKEASNPVAIKAKEEKKAVREAAKEDDSLHDYRPSQRFYSPDTMWHGMDSKGKAVTANSRQICNNCSVLLTGCSCGKPVTLTATYPNGSVCMEAIALGMEPS